MSSHQPQPIQHTLSPSALQTAYEYASKRNNKAFDGSDADIDSEAAHILGLKGELAFAEHYDLQPDLSINPHGGDDGHDFQAAVRGERRTIDVKATTYTDDPWLRVRCDRLIKTSDIYVLATVDGIEITFVGWVPKTHLKRKTENEATGRANLIAKPNELLPMFDAGEIQ